MSSLVGNWYCDGQSDECCVLTKQLESSFGPQLTPLREIRCLICSYLHHTFIDEPSLAKLVHFQVGVCCVL